MDPDLAVPRHVEFVIRESQLGHQLTQNDNPSSSICTKSFLTKNGHFLAVLRILIRDLVSFCSLNPRSGTQNVQKIRIRIRDDQPRSYFRELRNNFGLKYLNSLMRIRDGKNSDPGWKKFGSGINNPGSTTLLPGPKITQFLYCDSDNDYCINAWTK